MPAFLAILRVVAILFILRLQRSGVHLVVTVESHPDLHPDYYPFLPGFCYPEFRHKFFVYRDFITRVLLPGPSPYKIFVYQNFITRVLLPGSAPQEIFVYLNVITRVLLPGPSPHKIFVYQNFITRVLLPGS